MNKMQSKIYKLDDFILNEKSRTLSYSGRIVPINARAFEILLLLIENQGRIIGKKEFLEKIWTDIFVEENTLAVHISALRKTFEKYDESGKYIKTINRFGYTFVGDVFEISDEFGNSKGNSKNKVVNSRVNPQTNEESWQLYLKGRFLSDFSIIKQNRRQSLLQALDWFERAVEIDPNFALGYAGIGSTYCNLFNDGFLNFDKAARPAKTAARMALIADENLPEAHLLQACVSYHFEKNIHAAEQSAIRAITLNSNFARAYYWLSYFCLMFGKFAEALNAQQHAVRLEPASLTFNFGLARVFYYRREYQKSIAHLQETLKLDSRSPISLFLLALNYIELGLYNEALVEIEKYLEINFCAELLLIRAYTLAESGEKEKAEQLLDEIFSDKSHKNIDNSHIAYVYAALNNPELAFEHLYKALEKADCDIFLIKIDPRYKKLHGDARFDKFIHRLDAQPFEN